MDRKFFYLISLVLLLTVIAGAQSQIEDGEVESFQEGEEFFIETEEFEIVELERRTAWLNREEDFGIVREHFTTVEADGTEYNILNCNIDDGTVWFGVSETEITDLESFCGEHWPEDDFHNFEPIEGLNQHPEYEESFKFEEGDVFRVVRGSDDRFLDEEIFIYESLGVEDGKLSLNEYSIGGINTDLDMGISSEEWYEKVKEEDQWCESGANDVGCKELEVPAHTFQELGEYEHEMLLCDERNSDIIVVDKDDYINNPDLQARYAARDACTQELKEDEENHYYLSEGLEYTPIHRFDSHLNEIDGVEGRIFSYEDGGSYSISMETEDNQYTAEIDNIRTSGPYDHLLAEIGGKTYNLEYGVELENGLFIQSNHDGNKLVIAKPDSYVRDELIMDSDFNNEDRTRFVPGKTQIITDQGKYDVRWENPEADSLRRQGDVIVGEKNLDMCGSQYGEDEIHNYVEKDGHYVVNMELSCGLSPSMRMKAVPKSEVDIADTIDEKSVKMDSDRYEIGEEIDLIVETPSKGSFEVQVEGAGLDSTRDITESGEQTITYTPEEEGELEVELISKDGWLLTEEGDSINFDTSEVHETLPRTDISYGQSSYLEGEEVDIEVEFLSAGEYKIISEINGDRLIEETVNPGEGDEMEFSTEVSESGTLETEVEAPNSYWSLGSDFTVVSKDKDIDSAEVQEVEDSEKFRLSVSDDEVAELPSGRSFYVDGTYRTTSTYEEDPTARDGVRINWIEGFSYEIRPEDMTLTTEIILCDFEKRSEGDFAEFAFHESGDEDDLQQLCEESSDQEDTEDPGDSEGDTEESEKEKEGDEGEEIEDIEGTASLELSESEILQSDTLEVGVEGTGDFEGESFEVTVEDSAGSVIQTEGVEEGDTVELDIGEDWGEGEYDVVLTADEGFVESLVSSVGGVVDAVWGAFSSSDTDEVDEEELAEEALDSDSFSVEIEVDEGSSDGWRDYCVENGFADSSNDIDGLVECIEDDIAPNYFQGSVGENPEIAESLCQDLLGFTYDQTEAACSI